MKKIIIDRKIMLLAIVISTILFLGCARTIQQPVQQAPSQEPGTVIIVNQTDQAQNQTGTIANDTEDETEGQIQNQTRSGTANQTRQTVNQSRTGAAGGQNGQNTSHIVNITSSGFVPDNITINEGDTVTWVNFDSSPHWVASANHPSHDIYPTSGGCIGSTFDECDAMQKGETWSFTFDYTGNWNYHDHLNPREPWFGTVIVE